MEAERTNKTAKIAIIGSLIVAVILVLGTIWMGHSAREDTEQAVRSVSLLYLDELAGRREKVVESNLQNKIRDMNVAIELMTREDLSDMEHLQEYQSRMKSLYNLEKFAFVDTDGLIYTSQGTQTNIADYSFDYRTLSEAEISILNLESTEKQVVIAVPVEIPFEGKMLRVCFMEIDMQVMLAGVSMDSGSNDATFCNIYTENGIALSNTVLGGLSVEELERARGEARIVHWCGKMKPWMFTDLPLADVWRSWYERSPFAGKKLRLISRAGLSRMAGRAKERGAHE